jgi:hypothetical protein
MALHRAFDLAQKLCANGAAIFFDVVFDDRILVS